MLDIVMTVKDKLTKKKGGLLTVRTGNATLEDFAAVAFLKGATMSGLVHQYVVRSIREEKERAPGEFEEALKVVREDAKRKARAKKQPRQKGSVEKVAIIGANQSSAPETGNATHAQSAKRKRSA